MIFIQSEFRNLGSRTIDALAANHVQEILSTSLWVSDVQEPMMAARISRLLSLDMPVNRRQPLDPSDIIIVPTGDPDLWLIARPEVEPACLH